MIQSGTAGSVIREKVFLKYLISALTSSALAVPLQENIKSVGKFT